MPRFAKPAEGPETEHAPAGGQVPMRDDAMRDNPVRDNMEFWNALKRTDPKATKPFQRAGGFRGTQIDPAWSTLR